MIATLCFIGPAQAEMKDCQIRRLLNFKTDCQMDSFAPTGPGRFFASCRNITSYSDGVLLDCPDRIDKWTCKILTKPRHFENLGTFKEDGAEGNR